MFVLEGRFFIGPADAGGVGWLTVDLVDVLVLPGSSVLVQNHGGCGDDGRDHGARWWECIWF